MRLQVIKADTIEAAVERILDELKADDTDGRSRGNNNVIYFDGWDGLGASAVLRAVAQAAAGEKQFDQIIQVDCSKWESRRALQRAIAERLELPALVMEMFERQDEEDDFHGTAQGSRAEILQVQRAMHRRIQELNRRFLVIFHNGSSEEVDLASFGFPLSRYLDNKVLWTFQGRFRLYPRTKVERAIIKSWGSSASSAGTDIFLSASLDEKQDPYRHQELWSLLVGQEAAQVAMAVKSEMVAINNTNSCFFSHTLRLCCLGHNLTMDYDLGTHACNYWICGGEAAGIMQGGDAAAVDQLWHASEALQREMQLDADHYEHCDRKYVPCQLAHYGKGSMMYRTSQLPQHHGFLLIPAGAIPNADMFHQDYSSKLGVLKLSCRAFSFSSPPFVYCHDLRFLWLDNCHDTDDQETRTATNSQDGDQNDHHIQLMRRFFQGLWVLDVRYTRCDRILSPQMLDLMTQLRELNVMEAQDELDIRGQLQRRLPNIRRLRVTKSRIRSSSSQDGCLSLLGMDKMELLDFSGNHIITSSGIIGRQRLITNSSSIETVTISGGCVGLEEISLRGCAKLKNLVMGGSFEELCSIDISGTTVKTLDLSSVSTARKLEELLLLDCDELRAILWPPEVDRKKYLRKLRIDTTTKQQSISSKSSHLVQLQGARAPSTFDWYICVKDARVLHSLVPMKGYLEDHTVHMDISSSADGGIPAGGAATDLWGSSYSRNGGVSSSRIIDKQQGTRAAGELLQQHNADDAFLTTTTATEALYADVSAAIKDRHLLLPPLGVGESSSNCPAAPILNSDNCYMHIQDHRPPQLVMTSKKDDKSPKPVQMTASTTTTIPGFISDAAWILHVHDSLSIASIPGPARWDNLQWCRVERCPELEYIFTLPPPPHPPPSSAVRVLWCLRTLWASQLPRARAMWDRRQLPVHWVDNRSFEDLTLLHVDLCPRLRHVLPFSVPMINSSPLYLKTLEIVWCGDLRMVFPFDADDDTQEWSNQQQIIIEFPSLERIHLQELPRLQSICGGRSRMYAPNLESIKVRGCWSLKRLPDVRLRSSGAKQVECDCEKEWWYSLQWDGLQQQAYQYKPRHSRYYKRPTQLRGSVLR